jgi:hypothetical protein
VRLAIETRKAAEQSAFGLLDLLGSEVIVLDWGGRVLHASPGAGKKLGRD